MFSPYGFGSMFYMMYGASFLISILMMMVYFLPLIQIFITNERKKWLEKHFENSPSSGESEDAFRIQLMRAASPSQSYPLYKLLKFYLVSTGIAAFIIGFLYLVLPESFMRERELSKLLSFIPAIVGVGMYLLYKNVLLNHGLWREVAGFFLLLGVTVTTLAVYENYQIYQYLRSDILLYIILAFGLFVMHHLKSVVASYLYMAIVIFGASFVSSAVGYNWMLFMTHFIWFFALGVLSFWLPRLRDAKQIEFKELLFGVLFLGMIFSLISNSTAGMVGFSASIIIPCLYIFSKIHFKNASWFGGRPIEVVIVLLTVVSAVAFSTSEIAFDIQRQLDFANTSFSFQKVFVVFLLLIAILIGYTMYADQTKEDQKQINLFILFYPIGAYLLLWFVGDYGAQYLINIFLLILGITYLNNGLKAKDSIQLVLASFIIIAAIAIRLPALEEYLRERAISSLIIMVFGGLFVGLAGYMRSKWNATGPNQPIEPQRSAPVTSSNDSSNSKNDIEIE